MRKTLLSTIVLLTVFISCKKHDDQATATRDNILSNNAHIVDTTAIVQSDLTSVTLRKANLNFSPSVGDILLASPSAKDTVGLLVKVLSVTTAGSDIVCRTELSSLNDAFRQLLIDYTYNQPFQSSAQYRGNGIDGIGSELGISFNSTSIQGLKLTGSLKLNFPETQIKYVKQDGSILPDTVIIRAGFNTDGSNLSLETTGLQVPQFTLHKFRLPYLFVAVPVGPLILIIPFEQKVDLNVLPATVNGKMKLKVYPTVSASLGFSYERGNWKNLSNFTIGAGADDLKEKRNDFDPQVVASLTIFKPEYQINPLGTERFSATFGIPNNLELTIQKPEPNYELKYNLNVEAAVKAKIWTGVEASYSLNATLIESTILKNNFVYHIGDTAFGGIVFYLDSSRRHGLVYTRNDAFSPSQTYWFPYEFYPTAQLMNPNSSDTLIGSGKSNTDKIVNAYGNRAYAANLCKNYSGGGYNDWFLPSKNELQELYQQKNSLPSLPANSYWTSSSLENYYLGTPSAYFAAGQVWCINLLSGQATYHYLGNSSNGFWPSRDFYYLPIRMF